MKIKDDKPTRYQKKHKKTNKIVFIYKSSLLKRSVLKRFDKNFRVD